MKMPATTTFQTEAKATTPIVDTADAAKQCIFCLEKKVRNLEKRKGKIELSREKADKGSKLEKEQEVSLKNYEQVTNELQFARELHKQFLCINQENEKLIKKQSKREKAERQATEIKRIGEILRLQSTLNLLGADQVREDFKTGKHGAVVLTEDNLDQLDQLYQEISPSRDDCEDYPQKLNTAADHLVNILDGKDRQVMGTTYKELKELLTLINECGYFEQAPKSEQEAGDSQDQEEETFEEVEDVKDESALANDETETAVSDQKSIDISGGNLEGNAQSQMEAPVQPMNTLEQDAFFAPSSTPYQTAAEAHFSQPSHNSGPTRSVPDFQSFTNNRPFQFIQTSYIMPDPVSPSVVDPAVIAAQPAGGSGLQFMSQGFEPSTVSSSAAPPPQSQQPQPAVAAVMPSQLHVTPKVLGMPVDLSQGSVQQPTQQTQSSLQQQPQDFSAQNFAQSENLFPAQSVGHEEVPLSTHSEMMGQMRDENLSSSSYDIPPSIPMPPSQAQEQNQLDQHGKKFPMNVNATVFQSMYTQQQADSAQSGQVNMPTPVTGASDLQASIQTSDFTNSSAGPNGDFSSSSEYQQGYQGSNGFPTNGTYNRGGGTNRGGYRGPRGGAGGVNNRTGGNPMQNGFGGRGGAGSNSNNSRGGRGGYNQGYAASANYRSDGFQGNYNSSGFVNSSAFSKRGGMNNAGGPGSGYPRGGTGGNGGGRGGTRGVPRGAGGQRGNSRGGFNRPLAQ